MIEGEMVYHDDGNNYPCEPCGNTTPMELFIQPSSEGEINPQPIKLPICKTCALLLCGALLRGA
jgi:hypothetical protein